MLARTVVVILARAFVSLDQPVAGGHIIRGLRTTAQIGIRQPKPCQPGLHPVGVNRRPLMRRTGQRQLIHPQAHGIGGPAFDQRQGLDHLKGGPGIDHCARIAPAVGDFPIRPGHNDMAPMDAFHQITAPHFDQIHRSHCFSPVSASFRANM